MYKHKDILSEARECFFGYQDVLIECFRWYANSSTSQALIQNFENKCWYHELNSSCYLYVICYYYMLYSLMRNKWGQILEVVLAGHYA